MNLAELKEAYKARKLALDSAKKEEEKYKALLKDAMLEAGESDYTDEAGYRFERIVQERKSMDEEKLLAELHERNLTSCIATKEVVDEDATLKAFESLCGDGHSGFSIGITKGILNRLIEGKPLTPIEDTEDVWNVCSRGENGGVATYQCKRMSSLFKDVYPDGTVKYHDNDRYYCIKWDDPNLCWHNGFIGKIYSEMFPLTMPYMPSNKADVIVCDELLTDRKNGDFDTLAVLYIQRSHGEKVEVNRYFKEGEKSFIEISPEEYEERKKMHEKRQEQEAKAQDEN